MCVNAFLVIIGILLKREKIVQRRSAKKFGCKAHNSNKTPLIDNHYMCITLSSAYTGKLNRLQMKMIYYYCYGIELWCNICNFNIPPAYTFVMKSHPNTSRIMMMLWIIFFSYCVSLNRYFVCWIQEILYQGKHDYDSKYLVVVSMNKNTVNASCFIL